MTSRYRGSLTAVLAGVAAVVALTGCSMADQGVPPAPATTEPTLSAQARADIAAAQAQADAAHATAAPTAVASDTIRTWPALDHGTRPHATGPASRSAAGVYTYTVQPDDVVSVIALRFGLCNADLTYPASDTGVLTPGEVLTLERRMTQDGVSQQDADAEHSGWRCNYPG
ncbi:LysM peptidoglycan-binding domain-containing protein [Curtobacterium sp. MCPF17_011]|uniref:LysM peptidoglycan-binding domain-containing protein n=1 Tax=Curtobacterium sp. MCPF17_011 TaxID=2175652 RepID=UPI0015E89188|nr:LysM peptidoglycan-binding domain-containing protein [Curtobacterium sp. MCPF17_011]